MSYAPAIDFIALLRQTAGGVRSVRMPGLDYVVAAMARAGLFNLWTGQTAPTSNQATTVWLMPQPQSWAGEGTVLLWNATLSSYENASPALWSVLLGTSVNFRSIGFAQSPYSVASGDDVIFVDSSAGVVVVNLQPAAARAGKPIEIKDVGNAAAANNILIVPAGAETIENLNPLPINANFGGFRLYPAPTNRYVIAP